MRNELGGGNDGGSGGGGSKRRWFSVDTYSGWFDVDTNTVRIFLLYYTIMHMHRLKRAYM